MRGELRRKIIEGERAAEKAVGELLGALERAVREAHPPRMMRGEVRGGELDHLSRADKQHVLLANARVNMFRQADCRGGQRNRGRADVSLGAHGFRHREGALEKLVEEEPERARCLRRAHRLLELAEDLGFAQHHRIEAACHPEGVLDRALLRQTVEIGLDLSGLQAVVVGHPVDRRGRLVGVAVDLGAIAGRDDGRFLDRAVIHQVAQGFDQLFGVKYHLLAHR